jgi:hypothetical protein
MKFEMKPVVNISLQQRGKKDNVRGVNTVVHCMEDNTMIFVNMNMKELKVLLERKFGIEIEISDSRAFCNIISMGHSGMRPSSNS